VEADDNLYILGRKDHQLKVRGHRIEAAEVEIALLQVNGIKEAAVVARPDAHGESRLAAYIVPSAIPPPTVSAIHRSLAERLPDYMIPSAFVFIDSLPLAASGKVVRRLLPDPGPGRPELAEAYVAPRSPVEQTLTHIWEEVLVVDPVGIDDPFLELGGHSLQAARIIARVLAEFRVELPVRTLFESPTVAAMAAVIAAEQAEQIGSTRLEELLRGLEALPEAEAQQLLARRRYG
jgi:acyl carrier protein